MLFEARYQAGGVKPLIGIEMPVVPQSEPSQQQIDENLQYSNNFRLIGAHCHRMRINSILMKSMVH